MKTKQIPAIVMLSAGFVTCLTAIFQNMELMRFTKILLVVLICFYILGCIISYILNKNFNNEKPIEEETTKETAEDEPEADIENIEAENEQK